MAVLWQKREETEDALVGIATCGLHTIHGAFKYGVEKSDWNLKKILKGWYILLMIAQINEMSINLSLALKISITVLLDTLIWKLLFCLLWVLKCLKITPDWKYLLYSSYSKLDYNGWNNIYSDTLTMIMAKDKIAIKITPSTT